MMFVFLVFNSPVFGSTSLITPRGGTFDENGIEHDINFRLKIAVKTRKFCKIGDSDISH
jgi:hypothetical protein